MSVVYFDISTLAKEDGHLANIDAKTPALSGGAVPVVGIVSVSGSVLVSGTFWQATQPVSAASLPLPTGAATEAGHLATIDTNTARLPALGQALAAASVPVVLPATQITTLTPPAAITGFATVAKQPALGTAGSPSADVLTVQGIASGVAQPVSGTVTANAGTNLNTSALSKESGGNLDTLVARTPALGAQNKAGSRSVTLATDQGNLPVQGGFTEMAGLSAAALNADLLPATDVSAYKWISLHTTNSVFSGALAFQQSNDGVNWLSANVIFANNVVSSAQSNATAANQMYHGPLFCRYFRIRMTTYVSGTATGVVELFTSPTQLQTIGVGAAQIGTWTVQPGNTPNTTPWLTADNDGTVKANNVAIATGGNARLVAGSFLEQASLSAAALNADLVPSVDVSAYKWISLQVSGTFSAAISFQCSNDQVTWLPLQLMTTSLGSTITTSSTGSAQLYHGPITSRYIRIRLTSYTSGTATGTLELYTVPSALPTLGVSSQQNGTWSVVPIPNTTGGATPYHYVAATGTNAQNVKSGGGQIYSGTITNAAAYQVFVKFYNSASAPTAGSGSIVKTVGCPAGGTVSLNLPVGSAFSAGIGFTITKLLADTDTTGVLAGDCSVDIDYR